MASSGSSSEHDAHGDASVSLDSLVNYLLAAKRSLASTELVARADAIVTETREALVLHTMQRAQTIHLQQGCHTQLKILRHVRDFSHQVGKETGIEFETIVRDLDAANAKLKDTMGQLRDTIVESKLRPEDESPRSLLEFADESGPQGILDTIKATIDQVGSSRTQYKDSISPLSTEISSIEVLLSPPLSSSGQPDLDILSYHSPVPGTLHAMEDHASEMSENLTSLVSHFDLCVTALKQTDGGEAAALAYQKSIQNPSASQSQSQSTSLSFQLSSSSPIPDLTASERISMLSVLTRDAAEVEDVVSEIHTNLTSIISLSSTVSSHSAALTTAFSRTKEAYHRLSRAGETLPNYITQSSLFALRWDDSKSTLTALITDLHSARHFYASFLGAYDALLIEIGRRKNIEMRMKRVRDDALAKIERLHAEDVRERALFKEEMGGYLPSDLWSGVNDGPQKWELRRVEEGGASVPDISASVIKSAIDRFRSGGSMNESGSGSGGSGGESRVGSRRK